MQLKHAAQVIVAPEAASRPKTVILFTLNSFLNRPAVTEQRPF
jgi:hypothetical protein